MTVEIPAGAAMIEGRSLSWRTLIVTLEPNRSWFRARIDLISMRHGGTRIHSGPLSLFSRVAPECPAGEMSLAEVVLPSRLSAICGRIRSWWSEGR